MHSHVFKSWRPQVLGPRFRGGERRALLGRRLLEAWIEIRKCRKTSPKAQETFFAFGELRLRDARQSCLRLCV